MSAVRFERIALSVEETAVWWTDLRDDRAELARNFRRLLKSAWRKHAIEKRMTVEAVDCSGTIVFHHTAEKLLVSRSPGQNFRPGSPA